VIDIQGKHRGCYNPFVGWAFLSKNIDFVWKFPLDGDFQPINVVKACKNDAEKRSDHVLYRTFS